MAFHCTQVFILLAYFTLAPSRSITRFVIFIESTKKASEFASNYSTSKGKQIELLHLDGTDCNEFTTGGNLLASGIEQASVILQNYDDKNQVNSLHLAIVSTRCLRECLILHSVIQRYHNVSVATLSVSATVHDIFQKVVHLMPPSTLLINALFILSKSLLWNRLGLVVDSTNIYTTTLADYITLRAKQQNITIFPIIESKDRRGKIKDAEDILQQIQESGAKVLVLLTQEAPQILCAAHHRGMVWPHYGWLLYGSSSPDNKQLPTCRGSHHYLEGIVFPTYYSSLTTKASLEESAIQLISKASTAATQLHIDLKSAMLRMTVPGIQENLTFHNIQHNISAVYFIQVRNGTATSVATVHNDTVLVNRWLQEEELPRGTLPVRVNTVYPTWLGALEITVSGTLITITLVLYVYYRKEPEVRATSWTLSLFVIFGCYMLTIYLLLIVLRTAVPPTDKFNLCPLLVWTSGVGLSLPLIIVVLLVKLARVYRIFYHYGEIGKSCSDMALAVYVLLLLIPSISILTVMTALQPYHWSTETNTYTNYTEVKYICAGDLTPYYIAQVCYIILLKMCVVAIVLKTRKVRYRNFRDAKIVNTFVFILVLVSISGLAVFKVFSDRKLYLPTYTCLHVTTCIVIVACLGLLFMPKLSPIIKRKYTNNMTNSPITRKNYMLDSLSLRNASPQTEQSC